MAFGKIGKFLGGGLVGRKSQALITGASPARRSPMARGLMGGIKRKTQASQAVNVMSKFPIKGKY